MTFDSKQKIELNLFVGFPRHFLEEEGVASALQSFETAVYCIALRRWPATVELVWQASELLLRHLYKHAESNWSSIDAMNTHLNNGRISSDLSSAAHDLRKTRNAFIHNGFSPKDDHLSIKTYFEAGVPYFANLLKSAFDQDLYQYIGTGTTGNWFWEVYKNTRKLVTGPDTNEKNSWSRTLLFVLSCHKVVTVGGRFEGAFRPYNHYEYLLEKSHQDIAYGINIEIIEDFLRTTFSSDSYDIAWLKVDCDICGSELMGNCGWDQNDQFVELKEFGCAKCGYAFHDPKEAKCFIGDRVFQGKKQIAISEVTFVRDRLSFFFC